jgi:hypothetical protein
MLLLATPWPRRFPFGESSHKKACARARGRCGLPKMSALSYSDESLDGVPPAIPRKRRRVEDLETWVPLAGAGGTRDGHCSIGTPPGAAHGVAAAAEPTWELSSCGDDPRASAAVTSEGACEGAPSVPAPHTVHVSACAGGAESSAAASNVAPRAPEIAGDVGNKLAHEAWKAMSGAASGPSMMMPCDVYPSDPDPPTREGEGARGSGSSKAKTGRRWSRTAQLDMWAPRLPEDSSRLRTRRPRTRIDEEVSNGAGSVDGACKRVRDAPGVCCSGGDACACDWLVFDTTPRARARGVARHLAAPSVPLVGGACLCLQRRTPLGAGAHMRVVHAVARCFHAYHGGGEKWSAWSALTQAHARRRVRERRR